MKTFEVWFTEQEVATVKADWVEFVDGGVMFWNGKGDTAKGRAHLVKALAAGTWLHVEQR